MSLLRTYGVEPDEWEPPEPEEDEDGFLVVKVHFENEEDVQEFAELLGVPIQEHTKRVVWPPGDEVTLPGGALDQLLGKSGES